MKPRTRRSGAILAALGAWALCVAGVAAADITVDIRAGLGTLAKAGRILPVVVDLTATGAAANLEVAVTFGDARAVRAVSFSAPGTRRLEFYLRTSEVAPNVQVRVTSAGETVVTRDVPVRVLAQDEPVTLCVTRDSAAPLTLSCTATVTVAQVPRSSRGLDIVDAVEIAVPEALTAEARRQLAVWRVVRSLDASGDLSLTPQVTRPMLPRGLSAPATAQLTWTMALYALMLTAVAYVGRTRASLTALTVAGCGAIATASGAALTLGHWGSASAVRVHHTTLLQQVPDTGASLVSMRGVAEFPAAGEYRVALDVEDAVIEPASPRGRADQTLDDRGFPVLSGRFGLSARRAFVAEGILSQQLLGVEDDGRDVRIVNQSGTALEDCAFSDGFSRGLVGELAAGSDVSAERTGIHIGPMFTCTAPQSPLTMDATGRDVHMLGPTTVALYPRRHMHAATKEPGR